MKTPKPIKRHAALVELSKDHHFGLLLVWKIRQGMQHAVDRSRIAPYICYFFEQDLQFHFEEEEKYLFGLLEGDELTNKAIADHEELRGFYRQFKAGSFSQEDLANFADRLEVHIRFEERELFKHYQDSLTENQLDQLLSVPWRKDSDPDIGWEDKFWERASYSSGL